MLKEQPDKGKNPRKIARIDDVPVKRSPDSSIDPTPAFGALLFYLPKLNNHHICSKKSSRRLLYPITTDITERLCRSQHNCTNHWLRVYMCVHFYVSCICHCTVYDATVKWDRAFVLSEPNSFPCGDQKHSHRLAKLCMCSSCISRICVCSSSSSEGSR